MEKEKIKPEPLKDKEYWLHHIYNDYVYAVRKQKHRKVACLKGFVNDDIKAAVEWLKDKYNQIEKHHYGFWDDELKNIYEKYTDVYMFNKDEFRLWLLDKAFEDVVKDESQTKN